MKQRSARVTVFLAVLIDLLGFGIVLPLLPFYAAQFSTPPLVIGLLYSTYSLAQLVFAPVWGSVSDRIGRRPVMLVSTFGAAMAYLLFGFAHTLSLLFVSRLLAGIMGGNISTAQAYIADITGPEDRAEGMGLIGAAFGIGFVLGPALGSFLIHPVFLKLFHIPVSARFSTPGIFAALLSLTSFLLVFFELPETVRKGGGRPEEERRLSLLTPAFWQSLMKRNSSGAFSLFAILVGCTFLFSFAQSSLYSSFPLFCKAQLMISEEKVGILYAYLGLIAAAIQGGGIRILIPRFGEANLFFMGSGLAAAGFLLIPFAHSLGVLILFLTLVAAGTSLAMPTLNSLISKEADPAKVGRALGTSQGMASLGRVIGPAWGGFLYGMRPSLPFIATAFALMGAVGVGNRLRKESKFFRGAGDPSSSSRPR